MTDETTPHGERCRCDTCGTVRFNIHHGRADVAIRAGYRGGVITEEHWRQSHAGADVLRIAGFGAHIEPQPEPVHDPDPDHELRAALAEVRRLRDGIGQARGLLDRRLVGMARLVLRGLILPADLT